MKINKNLPNILTISRICLTPIVVLLFLLPINNGVGVLVSFGIYVLASCTDFVDGMIARKYNLVSDTGKLLDAAADKFLQTSALILVILSPVVKCANWIKVVLLLVFLLRDAWISAVRQLCASKGIIISADVWGKAKSILMDIAIGVLFVFIGVLPILNNGVLTNVLGIPFGYLCVLGLVLLAISAVFSIASAINYSVKSLPKIMGKQSSNPNNKTSSKDE